MIVNTINTHIAVKLSSHTRFVLSILAVTELIAWTIENSWFNLFVFDRLLPGSRWVAWMVIISVITASLTSLLFGTLSDRTRFRLERHKLNIPDGMIGLTMVIPLNLVQKVRINDVELETGLWTYHDSLEQRNHA